MTNIKSKVHTRIRFNRFKVYSIVLLFILLLVFIIVFKTNIFNINNIIITNNQKIDDTTIKSYSGIDIGDNIFKINLKDAQEKIENNSYIKEAKIKRILPNKVHIDIKERKTIAAVNYMGIYFLIDDESYLLEISETLPDTYIINGFEFEKFTKGEKVEVKNLEDFNNVLKLCSGIKNQSIKIKPIITYNDGEILLLTLDDLKIKLGSVDNLEDTLKKLATILMDLESKGIRSGEIDMSSKGHIIYRPFGK